jgi:hypothetical protein
MADADPDTACETQVLADITEALNNKGVAPAHGTNR